MTTSHVTVDTPTLPAAPAGAGSAASRNSKAKSGSGQTGFSALLDSLARPSSPQRASQADAKSSSKPPSATDPGTSRPVELKPEKDTLDDADAVAPDAMPAAIHVAALPLIEPPAIRELAGAAPPDASAVAASSDEAPTAVVDGKPAALPAVPAPDATGAPLLATPDETALPIDEPAAEKPPTDVAPVESLDSNGRLQPGRRAPASSLPLPAKTTGVTTAPPPAGASSPAPVATATGTTEHVQPRTSIDTSALARGASQPQLRDEPAAPPVASDAPALSLAAATESRTAGEWSGQDGFSQAFGRAQTLHQASTGPASERVAAGFVVPAPVTEMTRNTDAPATSASANEASGSREADQAGLEGQLVQSMRTLWRGGVGEARVTLKPEYLGAVTISLRLESGGLHAHLQVEDPQVAAWVQAHESLLKNGLAGQGLTLERLVVSDESKSRDQRGPQGDRERREPRRQGRGASDSDGAGFTLDA